MLVINNVSQQLVLFPSWQVSSNFNHLNDEINPICPFLALFGTHHILHVSRLTAWFCFPAINKHRTIKPANISFQHNVKGSKNSNCVTLQHVALPNMCLSLCTNNTILLSRNWSLISVILNTFAQSIYISLHAHNLIISHTPTSPYWSSLLTQTSAPTVTFWQL